jgi:hypothetical protein
MVAPVRVKVAGNGRAHKMEMAYTLDASERGVRLAGLKCEPNVGDQIEIQYRHERAWVRVVWVRRLENSSDVQLGAECVEQDKNIWGTAFEQRSDEYQEKD